MFINKKMIYIDKYGGERRREKSTLEREMGQKEEEEAKEG
ncbi:hypothetical protein FACS189472_14130 [Alphaproteobacteria bacterium]|nr:hypothetical protein FACS189472_14130 [Alphaproteobacteria bacterium]